jgi:N-acetylneuraminate synthase
MNNKIMGNKILNNKHDLPYLIAEIGINHNGDLEIAKKLIDATNACNWDCVKFQKRNPDICVPNDQKGVMRETPWGRMKYIEYKYKVEFGKQEYDIIDEYCNNKPLDWTVSVWDLDSLNFIKDYNVPFIKIPSAHITNEELLSESTKTRIPIIISTGMSTWKMIDNAVEILEKGNASYAVLHCNSTYPAPIDELNLNIIPVMKKRYGCMIGYSGHEYDLDPSVLAVAMGAEIIERHITLDHNMWGTDHKSSLEVHAMDLLKKRIKDVNKMLGGTEKIITPSEEPVMKKLRG